jgi:hypothetical protein
MFAYNPGFFLPDFFPDFFFEELFFAVFLEDFLVDFFAAFFVAFLRAFATCSPVYFVQRRICRSDSKLRRIARHFKFASDVCTIFDEWFQQIVI